MDEKPKSAFTQRISVFSHRYSFWIVIGIMLVLLALVFEAGRWSVYRAHSELSSMEQANAILVNVGKLIQLPNEQPTMATINDAASVKEAQPFLINAENGDVLIVYSNAREALLYRPATNKLIAVGPVDNAQNNRATIPTPAPITASSTNATTTESKK
jgi:hypothetical protein